MGASFYVSIMTNDRRTVLYTGVTSDIVKRVTQHQTSESATSFTSRYNVKRLVFIEEYPDPETAIAREKQIKGWTRKKKVTLIEALNPAWKDLFE